MNVYSLFVNSFVKKNAKNIFFVYFLIILVIMQADCIILLAEKCFKSTI